jgi:hypothetical protein
MSRQIRLGFLILCVVAVASAYVTDYLPLTQAEIARRVPQKPVPIDLQVGAQAQFGTATIRLEDDNRLVIGGKDKGGRPWQVVATWSLLGGEFFSCDLDRDGTQDLVFIGYTGGNGLAPSSHVLTLMFDDNGRPVPSEFDGYFEADRQGVRELVDLNQDGHAQLIRQSFNNGYWITSLYEARDAHWFLVHGKHGSRGFPLYTRFTDGANRVATTPLPGRNPREDDLSNSTILSGAPTRIEKLEWADVAQSKNPAIVLGDGRTCGPVAWYSTMGVVLGRAAGRRSATLGAAEDAKELLEEIVHDKLPVRVSGHRFVEGANGAAPPDACVPELIWAGER